MPRTHHDPTKSAQQLRYTIQVRFTDQQRDILRVLAELEDVTASEIVRRSVQAQGESWKLKGDGRSLAQVIEDGDIDAASAWARPEEDLPA